MHLSIKATKDGSHTIYNELLDETYHSIHGARQEALHVFIENGLNRMQKGPLRILEIGLGTGLNAFLTYKNRTIEVEYVGLEPFPLSVELLENYMDKNVLNTEERDDWHQLMCTKDQVSLNEFSLTKVYQGILDYTSLDPFDLVYFDAFAPNKQEDMWQPAVFQHIHSLSHEGTHLVTYCAQGQFKRNLKMAGFEVNSLPGPPGKREMTLAIRR